MPRPVLLPASATKGERGAGACRARDVTSLPVPVPVPVLVPAAGTDLCSRTLCTESRSSRFLVTGRGMLYRPAPNIAAARGPFIAAARPAAPGIAAGRGQVGAPPPAPAAPPARPPAPPAGAAPRGAKGSAAQERVRAVAAGGLPSPGPARGAYLPPRDCCSHSWRSPARHSLGKLGKGAPKRRPWSLFSPAMAENRFSSLMFLLIQIVELPRGLTFLRHRC